MGCEEMKQLSRRDWARGEKEEERRKSEKEGDAERKRMKANGRLVLVLVLVFANCRLRAVETKCAAQMARQTNDGSKLVVNANKGVAAQRPYECLRPQRPSLRVHRHRLCTGLGASL